jgi:SET domain
MHAPLSALVTPSSTASSKWPGGPGGKELTVRAHAKLASQVAFGDMRDRYAWFATWPTLLDFQTGLPLLWPERTREVYCQVCAKQPTLNGSKKLNGSSFCGHTEESFAVLPPPVTGLWATVPSPLPTTGSVMKSTTRETDGKPLLPSQRAKFNLDLMAARHLHSDLDFSEKAILDRFTWAWCIVSTRCFYYVAPGVSPPEDSDEAMVLCPGVDLFNHASRGCDVTYDNEGFWVRAERMYEPGEEIVTSYGPHGEDMLMVEYGFLMGADTNTWDGVGIDGVVLATMKAEEKRLLEDYGFLGGYTMRRDGVCWRTEVAARCIVMEVARWDRFVAGRWIDYEDEVDRQRKTKKKRRNGAADAKQEETPKQMANRKMSVWLGQVKNEAENSLRGLQAMTKDEIWRLFGASNDVAGIGPEQKDMVVARHDMVWRRWKQILDTSCEALKSLESDG